MLAYNISDASPVERQPSPLQKDVWLMPAGATDVVPPSFDSETHICFYNGTEWVLEKIETIAEEISSPVELPSPLDVLRGLRNTLLLECDWRFVSDYPNDDLEVWKAYRTKLRNLPQDIENGIVQAPSLNEFGELIFDSWPEKPI